MIKKLLGLTLVLLLIISSTTVVLATEHKNHDMQRFHELKEAYNLVELDESFDRTNLIKFETFEELEGFILELEKAPVIIELGSESEPNKISVSEVDGVGEIGLSSTEYQQTRHYRAWKPYKNGTIFSWENIWTSFKYKYVSGVPTITEITEVDSDVTGFNVGYTYTHRSSTYNLTENDTTCRVKTVGRGVFGVTIGDFEAGIPHTVNMEDYWVLTNE